MSSASHSMTVTEGLIKLAELTGTLRTASSIARAGLPVAGLIAVFVFFSVTSPFFFDASNLSSMVSDSATIVLCALGMTLIILVGEIDLSVGALTGFLGILLAMLLTTGLAWPLAALVIVIAGVVISLINGVVTVFGRIPSFIVTLGMMSIVTGLSFVLIGGIAVPIADDQFLYLLYFQQLAGLPLTFYIVAVCLVATAILRSRTAIGSEMVAVGLNREAAKLSGISVSQTRLVAFAVMGLLVGIGALLAAARLGSGAPNAFPTLTLDVIAAVVIGGASLSGGRASVWRTLVGALLIAVLNNGMTLLNVNSNLQFVVKGFLILFAVLLDQSGDRARRDE